MSAAPDDIGFMAEALRLSLTHLGQTSTNPSVGCIIVRDGVVVGRGVTALSGRPHAETEALAQAGDRARGATVYVTLEPCSHHGRTPPCADALVAAGVARVVVCVGDPDERVSGRGLQILRDAGIAVETGLLEQEGRRALAAYLTRKTKHRAHVTLKLAVSADGMIGLKGAGQVAITGAEARHAVQLLRAETDAILVGIGTAVADDPQLTVRLAGLEARSPVRIVLDRRLELPLTSKLATTARDVPVLVVTDRASLEVGARIPPSVLPDISPSRGEIGSRRALASANTSDIVETIGVHAPISPPEGEMSGRTEGGNPTTNPSADDPRHRTTYSAEIVETIGARASISPPEGEMSGRTEGGTQTTTSTADLPHRRAALQFAGVEIVQATMLADLLALLAQRGLSSLLVEGGAGVARAFLAAGLVDRIMLFTGPGEIGSNGIVSPITSANIPRGFTLYRSETFGPDRCDFYERDS